jgi:predicted transcriptional regulator
MDSSTRKPKETRHSITFAMSDGLKERVDSMVENTHSHRSCVIRTAIEKYLTAEGY